MVTTPVTQQDRLHERINFFLRSQAVPDFYPAQLTNMLKLAGFVDITEEDVSHFLNMMINQRRVRILSFSVNGNKGVEPHLEITE